MEKVGCPLVPFGKVFGNLLFHGKLQDDKFIPMTYKTLNILGEAVQIPQI